MRLKILSKLPDGKLSVTAATKDQHGNTTTHTITCSAAFYEELSSLVTQYESAKHLLSAAYGNTLDKTFRNGTLARYRHAEFVREENYHRCGTE